MKGLKRKYVGNAMVVLTVSVVRPASGMGGDISARKLMARCNGYASITVGGGYLHN